MSKHAAHIIAKAVEFKIPLSWGQIAGKWWGPKDVLPIISVHGWQDNAGTFDRLIPLLPKNFSYLAIDLPGHGHSSRLGHGQIYSTLHYAYILTIIMDHFKWEKIPLMGHSLGGISSFLFATIFGHKIDLLICLDSFKPFSWHSGIQIGILEQSMTGNLIADKRNRENSEPPTYQYDEMLDMYARGGYMSIEREHSKHLIDRGILPSANNPNRFYFTRDSRLKYVQPAVYTQETCIAMAKRISVPFCFIKSDGKDDQETGTEPENCNEAIDVLRGNPLFECHSVSGNHFVHLNNPENISGIITDFLFKYHQEQKICKL